MQTIALGWVLLFAFSPTAGTAADVGYQLDTKSLTVSDSPQIDEITPIQFEDRVWSAPGIEQATELLPPVGKFDFGTRPCLRLVGDFSSRQHFRLEGNGFPTDGPYWLDDVAWPLTRQLFHPSGCREHWFSGIAL